MKTSGVPANIKYIDPSYMIRSVKANAADQYYAMMLVCGAIMLLYRAGCAVTQHSIARLHRSIVFHAVCRSMVLHAVDASL